MECGVAQNRDLCLRTVPVAQSDGVVDDTSKIWMSCRFTVTGKSEDVRVYAFGMHLLEFLFQSFCHFLTCGTTLLWAEILIESTFTIDAVEGAYLSVGRHEVYS